jgi:hypothetical protein
VSLKTVHIIFITASTLLAFGFGAWSLNNYFSPTGALGDLVLGGGSVAFGVGLIFYGKYFWKKLKNLEYL